MAAVRHFHDPSAGAGLSPRLTDQEREWMERVGRRLRAEFAALVALVPAHERTGAGLERALGLHRAVAYRLMSALGTADDLEVLTRIPGAEGLRSCASAARHRLGDPAVAVLAGADSAIDDFQELIRASGGSHARLIARVRATKDGVAVGKSLVPTGRRDDIRRGMFDVVRALSGRSVAARTSVSLIRPCTDAPEQFEYVCVRAYVGFRALSGGLPLVLASWVTSPDNTSGRTLGMDYCNLAGEVLEGRETTGLLGEFCSSPLPIVASRDTTGRLIQILDRGQAGESAGMDAVTAYRLRRVGPLPSTDDPPIFLESTNLSVPAERMVADLYVHRSLATGCTPSVGLYLGRGTGGCDPVDRWHEQIEGSPVLGLLGQGLGNCHSDAWGRHAELSRYIFDQLGWDPREYVGYRIDERWPLWNCDYVMTLDYRGQVEANEAKA